jgi:hypothetical protein
MQFLELSWNVVREMSSISPAIRARAIEIEMDPEQAINWYWDMVGMDITCEGQLAMLTDVQVFWWSPFSEKYMVKVEGLNNLDH